MVRAARVLRAVRVLLSWVDPVRHAVLSTSRVCFCARHLFRVTWPRLHGPLASGVALVWAFPLAAILRFRGPGSLVGMDAAMRSPLHRPFAAHDGTSGARQAGNDRTLAEALLGASHPLVSLLRHSDTASEQLGSVTAAQAAGLVFLAGGLRLGLSLAIAGVVVQVGVVCRLAALRARRRDLCLDMIIVGRQALPLACVDRERRRLLDPRTSKQLAASIDETLEMAARPLLVPPAVRPIFCLRVIRRVAPELRQVASLLRGGPTCVRGVATVEWLLASRASPLYGVDIEPLQQELGRARYLLSLTP
jgi:hypothetical protein